MAEIHHWMGRVMFMALILWAMAVCEDDAESLKKDKLMSMMGGQEKKSVAIENIVEIFPTVIGINFKANYLWLYNHEALQ